MTEKNTIEDNPSTGRHAAELLSGLGDEAHIHEDMVRLGFWQDAEPGAGMLEDILARQDALVDEMCELLRKEQDRVAAAKASAAADDAPGRPAQVPLKQDSLRVQLRRQCRDRQSLLQAGLKQQRQEHRRERNIAWYNRQDTEITYLGAGVSGELNQQHSETERLRQHKLPVIASAAELAAAMGIGVPELRFLAFSRKTSRLRHYRQYDVEKKSGGQRRIAAPMPRLKRVQYWILDNILNKLPLHQAAHGFVGGRSIKTNATQHIAAKLVVNIDLEDFFPSISYPRVKGLFKALGYSRQVATILALLCTEYDFEEVVLDSRRYYVGRGQRKLPQGAPTSPALSNLVCRRLDARLAGMAARLGYEYSRYADDLTFSNRSTPAGSAQKLLWRCRQIIRDEGFRIHPDKTRILRPHHRQEVTGLVVNRQLGVARTELKKFRALLYQLDKDGIEGKHWNGRSGVALLDSILGYANYLVMIDPVKGRRYLEQVRRVREKHAQALSQHRSAVDSGMNKKDFRRRSAMGTPPRTPWWEAARKPFVPRPVESRSRLPEPMYRKAIQLAMQAGETLRSQARRKGRLRGRLIREQLDFEQRQSASVPDKVVSKQIEQLDRSLRPRRRWFGFATGMLVLALTLYLAVKFL